MKKLFVAQAYTRVANAGSKPSRDFENSLIKAGFKNIGLPSVTVSNGKLWWIWCRLSTILAKLRIKKDSIVALQYPEPRHINGLLFRAIQKKKAKSLVIIHDINELRGWPAVHPEILRQADFLIAHTPAMACWLRENVAKPEAKIVTLGVFDYLNWWTPPTSSNEDWGRPVNLVFAGRLDKSLFLEKINFPQNEIKVNLYGNGLTEASRSNKCLEYKGVCLPDELLEKITSYDFGLVWDGESAEECAGSMGEYLRYNSPYKLSSYIAAGLPVIVWSKMGMADFVKRNGVGICVDSLGDIPAAIASMTKEEYTQMRKSAQKLSQKLRNGFFSYEAIKKALA